MNYQDNEAFQEALPPIETALFECLAKLCTVRYFDLPEGHPQRVAGAVLLSRKQEVAWLIRQLVADAQHMVQYPVSDPARKDKACQHCDYRALCNTEQVL